MLRSGVPALDPRLASLVSTPSLCLQHIVENRAADFQAFLLMIQTLAPVAADLGHEFGSLLILEHDATTIGFDPFEDQFHDPVQQLVDIQRVAHGQGRAVHDLKIAASSRQPRTFRFVEAADDLAAFFVADRADDSRPGRACRLPNDVDFVSQAERRRIIAAGEYHQGPPQLYPVAAYQRVFSDLVTIDKAAVGAVQIDYLKAFFVASDLSVMSRDFTVV